MRSARSLPCDVYAAAGTPCVEANSTVRALYAAYNGPLYQVTRASDGTRSNIGLLSAGGYADARAQDAFCARTTCTITKVYDQSPKHNDLTIEPAGSAGPANNGAIANALRLKAGGHAVYAIKIAMQTGYRHTVGSGIPTGSAPEGMYMVTSGTNVNNLCCMDYGNAEAEVNDTGDGHMDALYIGGLCSFPPCTGPGPWIGADLENGIFQGNRSNPRNRGNRQRFVTAMLKNDGTTRFALKGGDATAGRLTTWYRGRLPTGYSPMHKEGSIVLGTGGDNSNMAIGSFFEGAIVSGYPTEAADDAVQSNIVSVRYSGSSGAGPGGTITTANGRKCVDVAGDDTGPAAAPVQLGRCRAQAADQHWTHTSGNALITLGRCLGITKGKRAPGRKVELSDCNGCACQVWVVRGAGSLLNPQSALCLDDPGSPGARLRVSRCTGASRQRFSVNGGGQITLPGGKCVDTEGLDQGRNGAAVQVGDCHTFAADQHWYHAADGTLHTLGVAAPGSKCLSISGGGTADGTKIELARCDGGGAQVWLQQSNGTLRNPHSGRCLDDPDGNQADGVQLQIWECNDSSAQLFQLHS